MKVLWSFTGLRGSCYFQSNVSSVITLKFHTRAASRPFVPGLMSMMSNALALLCLKLCHDMSGWNACFCKRFQDIDKGEAWDLTVLQSRTENVQMHTHIIMTAGMHITASVFALSILLLNVHCIYSGLEFNVWWRCSKWSKLKHKNQTQQHTINAQQQNMGEQKGGYWNKIWSKYNMEEILFLAQENSSNEWMNE